MPQVYIMLHYWYAWIFSNWIHYLILYLHYLLGKKWQYYLFENKPYLSMLNLHLWVTETINCFFTSWIVMFIMFGTWIFYTWRIYVLGVMTDDLTSVKIYHSCLRHIRYLRVFHFKHRICRSVCHTHIFTSAEISFILTACTTLCTVHIWR